MQIKPYKEIHQQGILTIEKFLPEGIKHCDFGIQIAEDGRIWVCVDGAAYLRFSPRISTYLAAKKYYEEGESNVPHNSKSNI